MNRTILFFVIVLLFIANQSIARIGETPEQCQERYGEVILIKDNMFGFTKGGFIIMVYFYDGKVERISFFKEEKDVLGTHKEFSENEIQTLLSANGGKRIWIKSEVLLPDYAWATEDGNLFANYYTLENHLVIVTKEFFARKIEDEKAKENDKLKDF